MNYYVETHHNGTLIAYTLDEAREFSAMFANAIIVDSNGSWRDVPLCLNQRNRLAAIHGFPCGY